MKFELEPLITDKKGNEFSDYKIDEFYSNFKCYESNNYKWKAFKINKSICK